MLRNGFQCRALFNTTGSLTYKVRSNPSCRAVKGVIAINARNIEVGSLLAVNQHPRQAVLLVRFAVGPSEAIEEILT